MKTRSNKLLRLSLLIISIYFFQYMQGVAQNKMNNLLETEYITKFDGDLMAEKHLTNCQLVRKRAKWNYGREYVYKIENEKGNIFITVGLHQSNIEAFNVAMQYLNDISLSMFEDFKGVTIGDKFWWWAADGDTNIVRNIVFIRKNALIIMSSHNFNDMLKLAKSIDEDMIKGESYISIDKELVIPKIKAITKEKDKLKINESAKINIYVIDLNNESLEYQFSPGITKLVNDPPNVFTFNATKNELKGVKKVKVVVINERNVVSAISEFEIECIE